MLVGQAATLHVGGQPHPCSVRSLSAAGLMGSIYAADLPPGPGAIAFAGGERLPGVVLWTRDWRFEFAFDRAIDAQRLLASLGAASDGSERRTDPRFAVDCAAKLRVNNRFYFGRIIDISCSGARFKTPGRLKQAGDGMLVAPDLPPLTSVIRWSSDGEFGLAFRERIPEAALDAWLAERALDT